MPQVNDQRLRLLADALFQGVFEEPLWHGFLGQLREICEADYAGISFLPPDRRLNEGFYFSSGLEKGIDLRQTMATYTERHPLVPQSLEEQTIGLEELSKDPLSGRIVRDLLIPNGVTDVRQMFVREQGGIAALLSISRCGGRFDAAAGILMSDLAPILRGVARMYIALERERHTAALTADATRRLHYGWLTLDNAGQVLQCDSVGARVLATSHALRRTASGRLTAKPLRLERDIYQALGTIAANPHARPKAIILDQDPWLDMLLMPAFPKSIAANAGQIAIAYVHADSWRFNDRYEQMAELFSLSPREARLALALSRGMNLTEAAVELGITIGSARTYSKSIYSKTGARGQPDLVRIIMRSVLAIAPTPHEA
jgi:DNA-binding CsgD family transcriptional regulator